MSEPKKNEAKIPAVLVFPGTKISSISTERALKHIKRVIEDYAVGSNHEEEDRIQVALDDIEVMLKAIER